MKTPPAYVRIEAHLRSLIRKGGGRDHPLPAEPELARQFGVSRMTVRQAFQRLVESGAVVRHRGRGSFASGPVLEEMPIRGTLEPAQYLVDDQAFRKRIVAYGERKAPHDVAKRFGIAPGAPLTYLELLRFVDDRIICRDRRYMPAAVHATIPVAEFEHDYITRVLRTHGYPFSNATIEVSAHAASAAEAKVLDMDEAAPVIERRIAFIADNERLVAFGRAIYPAERYTYRVRIRNFAP